MELIYDYLVFTDFNDAEDPEVRPTMVAMEFSVFRRCDQDIFTQPEVKERVNAKLFLKIVDECRPIVRHPLFTEYFEAFYRRAFFNSVAFILFHLAMLLLLNKSLNDVTTTFRRFVPGGYHFQVGHWKCMSTTCMIAKADSRWYSIESMPGENEKEKGIIE